MACRSTTVSGPHPESLLRIPLAAHLFGDSGVPIVVRGIDSRWAYGDFVGRRIDGFNPFHGAVFAGHRSHLADWLPHRDGSARPFNRKDGLVGELLFALHDYLHIWCYRWIGALWPELGFGTAPIARVNFEDMVFCHLLSEAVATVGLDYWYLACVRLNEVVPIGTAQTGLTASYSEAQDEEYRRFHPALRVQSPGFLETMTHFYCDGAFRGFSADDMEASPVLRKWLLHELSYGDLQRRYCREWFAWLSGGAVAVDGAKLGAPVKGSRRRQRRLAGQIGELLWAKVKGNEPCEPGFRFDREALWQPPAAGPRLYQFVNINRDGLPDREQVKALSPMSFRYLLHQFVGGFDQAEFPDEALALIPILYAERDFELGRCLLKDMKRVPVPAGEPLSMFLYN
jgi:hypothetical protein